MEISTSTTIESTAIRGLAKINGVIMEWVNGALFLVDSLNMNFIEVNKKAVALLGYTQPELLAMKVDQVINLCFDCFRERSCSDGNPLIKEAKLHNKDGKSLYVNMEGCYLEGCSGENQDRGVLFLMLRNPDRLDWNNQLYETDDFRMNRKDRGDLIETALDFPSIIGKSDKIREVCQLIGLVAKTNTTVLVQGETGTGKELIAQATHFHSQRARAPLVKVNCAALTETLLESELFGHRKGAFTGAIQDRKGRFELADGGTIILDEIGSMSLAGQAKLLRVLQEQEFEPVGESRSVKVDVRVIAITNADLVKLIDKGEFREDLYYRLNPFPIRIPPLRERKLDIPLLARHFLKGYTISLKKRIEDIEMDAAYTLMEYSWPGNVRELENSIEYAVILENGTTLSISSLPDKLSCINRPNRSLKENLILAERTIILEALSNSNGVKFRAANLLGIDRRNFSYFLSKHDIH